MKLMIAPSTAARIVAVAMSIYACGDDDGGALNGGLAPKDAGSDGGGTDHDPNSMEDGGAGSCDDDSDCDDHKICTGVERCVDHACRAGEPKPCSPLHPCDEEQGGCDCRQPSWDGDGYPAPECPVPGREPDCDDSNASINPGATEICDPGGVNEDCDPETINNPTPGEIGHGDDDGDGFVSRSCFNLDARLVMVQGDDCDDGNPLINKDAREECDYVDNDCDGDVDEDPNSTSGTLRVELYPDVDGDGFPARGEPVLACEGRYQPPGVGRPTESDDCDDRNAKINGSALELCDGVDNDCDGQVDAADDELIEEHDIQDTAFKCENGVWIIEGCPKDRRWCGGPVQQGCETDETTLENCRECGRACSFACGEADCERAAALALGYEHSCVITTDGNVGCWGFGYRGRLGTGYEQSSSTPSEVLRMSEARLIAAGEHNTCVARGESSQLYCWGSNANGLLANADVGNSVSTLPLPAAGRGEPILSDVVSIAIGASHMCAVRGTGELYCWGSEANGRLGNYSATMDILRRPSEAARAGGIPVRDAAVVTVGVAHGCMINDADGVECWGDNGDYQLGDPDFVAGYSDVVRPVPRLAGGIDKLSSGSGHNCALTFEGEVLCWGANDQRQLGRALDAASPDPEPVAGLGVVKEIAAGSTFTCALDDEGSVWCWGSNDNGERGDAAVEDSATPTRVEVGVPASDIKAGQRHVCAITETEHEIFCWGHNFVGQVGIGVSGLEPITVPQQVQALHRALN
jgi:alpha-tubulin suppressor-like RCC1 family protein